MDQGLIPRRYAKALFKVAAEKGAERRIYDLCGALNSAFADEPALRKTVANPFIANADKIKLLDTAAGATADDVLFADFLKLLIQNRRLDLIREMALAYRDIYRKANNIARVTVTSATPMSPEGLSRLKALIQKHLDGAKMEFTTKTDPDLIGGFTVAIDNERFDASVANELRQLKLSLIQR